MSFRQQLATIGRGSINYEYDRIQNLIERTSDIDNLNLPLGGFVYGEAGAGPNQVTSAGAKRYLYDAIGQVRTYNGFHLGFDPLGRLAQAERADSTRIDFGYDVSGERVAKTIRHPNGDMETYRYVFEGYQERRGERVWIIKAGAAKVVEIIESRGLEPDLQVLDALVAYANQEGPQPAPVEQLDIDGDASDVRAPDAADLELAVQRYWGHGPESLPVLVARWYHPDHLSTPTHTTDSAGTLVSHGRFHPYGAESEQFAAQPIYGFTGAEREPETELGLTRMGARWLAPALGRWVSPDPFFLGSPEKCVESPLECNLYSYAANNPVVFVDPRGLDVVVPIAVRPSTVGDAPGRGGNTYQIITYQVYDYAAPEAYDEAALASRTLTDPIGSFEMTFEGGGRGSVLGDEPQWAEMTDLPRDYGVNPRHAIAITDRGSLAAENYPATAAGDRLTQTVNGVDIVRNSIRAHRGGPQASIGCATGTSAACEPIGTFADELRGEIPSLQTDEGTYIKIPERVN